MKLECEYPPSEMRAEKDSENGKTHQPG